MKWPIHWLQKRENQIVEFDDVILFEKDAIASVKQLRQLSDVHVSGQIRGQWSDETIYVDLTIEGTMVVPCARTLEDVDYPFQIHSTEVYVLYKPKEDEDVRAIKGDVLDLIPAIFELIILEIPMRVIKEDAQFVDQGSNWKVCDEASKETSHTVDPRLAKLKELFKENN